VSISALLQGVRDELINSVSGCTSKSCGIRGGEGRPPGKYGGTIYTAVVPSLWSTGPTGIDGLNSGLDEYYAVDLVLSMRTGIIPDDRLMGSAFLDATKGLEPFIRSIMVVMRDYRYTDGVTGGVLTRANGLIAGANKIMEPLRWAGNDSQPSPVTPDWFGASGEDPRAYGWRFGIHYVDARRIQTEANLQ
jgi:hypothetical protein